MDRFYYLYCRSMALLCFGIMIVGHKLWQRRYGRGAELVLISAGGYLFLTQHWHHKIAELAAHLSLHVIVGLAALYALRRGAQGVKVYSWGTGGFYSLLGVYGSFRPGILLGTPMAIPLDHAENVIHFALGLPALFIAVVDVSDLKSVQWGRLVVYIYARCRSKTIEIVLPYTLGWVIAILDLCGMKSPPSSITLVSMSVKWRDSVMEQVFPHVLNLLGWLIIVLNVCNLGSSALGKTMTAAYGKCRASSGDLCLTQ